MAKIAPGLVSSLTVKIPADITTSINSERGKYTHFFAGPRLFAAIY
jgi:hypothetical protein